MSSLFTLFVIFILLFLFVSLIADSKYHDSATPVHKEIEKEYGTPAKTLFTSTKIITLHSDTTITDEDDEVAGVLKDDSEEDEKVLDVRNVNINLEQIETAISSNIQRPDFDISELSEIDDL